MHPVNMLNGYGVTNVAGAATICCDSEGSYEVIGMPWNLLSSPSPNEEGLGVNYGSNSTPNWKLALGGDGIGTPTATLSPVPRRRRNVSMEFNAASIVMRT
jgi:hypothetical protein